LSTSATDFRLSWTDLHMLSGVYSTAHLKGVVIQKGKPTSPSTLWKCHQTKFTVFKYSDLSPALYFPILRWVVICVVWKLSFFLLLNVSTNKTSSSTTSLADTFLLSIFVMVLQNGLSWLRKKRSQSKHWGLSKKVFQKSRTTVQWQKIWFQSFIHFNEPINSWF
jgi:hypothetical protein